MKKEFASEKEWLMIFLKYAPLICSVMVIGIHCYNVASSKCSKWEAFIEGTLAHGLFTAAVPIFFFVSGYLFYRNIDDIKSVFVKQKRRIISDLLPYVVYSVFYYVFYAVACNFISLNTIAKVDLFHFFRAVIFYEYVFPMWFLFQLLIFILLAPLIYYLLKYKATTILTLLLTGILGLLKVEIKVGIGDLERVIFASNFFFYYFLGGIAVKYSDSFIKIINTLTRFKISVMILATMATSVLAGLIFDGKISASNQRIVVPVVTLLVFSLINVFCSCKKNSANLTWGGDKFLGRFIKDIQTMVVYGLHPFVGIVIGRILSTLNLHGLLLYFVSFLLVTLITCYISIIINKLKILNFLFNGNR